MKSGKMPIIIAKAGALDSLPVDKPRLPPPLNHPGLSGQGQEDRKLSLLMRRADGMHWHRIAAGISVIIV